MAWQADGFWKPESVDVQNEVNKVASSNSPLMKQAAAKGQAKASARGLGNSSIAASAAQGEVLDRAIAIGGKQADILGATNNQQLQGQWSNKTAVTVQGMSDSAALQRLQEGNAAEMARLDKSIAASAALAKQGDQAAMERLQSDLASRAQLQAVDVASRERIAALSEAGANTRQGLELTNRTDLAKLSEAGADRRQTADITSRRELAELSETGANTRQAAELAAREILQNQELTSREKIFALEQQGLSTRQAEELAFRAGIAQADRAGQMDIARLDATTRLNIGQMEIDANAKNNALNAYVNLQSNYMTSLSQSMTNAKLPPGVRASFQTSLKDVTNAGMDFIKATTGTTLDWGNVPAAPAPAPTGGLSSIVRP